MQNQNPRIKECFVAFIDVLGFSDMIHEDGGSGRFLKIIQDAITAGAELLKKRKEETGTKYAFWFEEFKVKSFSDCFCFSIPLEFERGEKDYKQNLVAFYVWLKVFYNTLLSKGFLCRGGIAQGWHYIDEDLIFSKALVDAYQVESKRADHPIIMIHETLLNKIQEHHLVHEPYYKYMFAHDNAGRNFLHPFNYSIVDEIFFGFREGKPSEKDLEERTELLNKYLKILDDKIRTNKGKKAADKYQWLKEFLLYTEKGRHKDKFSSGLSFPNSKKEG